MTTRERRSSRQRGFKEIRLFLVLLPTSSSVALLGVVKLHRFDPADIVKARLYGPVDPGRSGSGPSRFAPDARFGLGPCRRVLHRALFVENDAHPQGRT